MFRAYFRRQPWASRAYGGAAAILVLLLAQLQVALMINHLNKRFYDVWADPGRHYLSEAYTALLPFLWTGSASARLPPISRPSSSFGGAKP